MRTLSLLLSLLCVATPAFAQSTERDAIEPSTFSSYASDSLLQQWLASKDPRLAAWSAHFMIEGKRTAMMPDLEATIERWEAQRAQTPAVWTEDRRKGMVALLDAEIQLYGQLPAKTIDGLDKSLDTQRLVLLALLPWKDAGPVWSSLYQPEDSGSATDTRVAAQMLAQHATAEFAAKLLRTVSIRVAVVVIDPGGGSGIGIGFGCGGSCGSGIRRLDRPWPDVGVYSLHDPPTDRKRPIGIGNLWMDGPDPIYLQRVVSQNYFSGCGSGIRGLNDALRSHLVGTLLGGSPASPFPEDRVILNITFKDREAYRTTVANFVEDQQRNFQQMTTALTVRGLLTEEERQAAALPIELTLRDARQQPAEDLPAIAFRPPVTWVGDAP